MASGNTSLNLTGRSSSPLPEGVGGCGWFFTWMRGGPVVELAAEVRLGHLHTSHWLLCSTKRKESWKMREVPSCRYGLAASLQHPLLAKPSTAPASRTTFHLRYSSPFLQKSHSLPSVRRHTLPRVIVSTGNYMNVFSNSQLH